MQGVVLNMDFNFSATLFQILSMRDWNVNLLSKNPQKII